MLNSSLVFESLKYFDLTLLLFYWHTKEYSVESLKYFGLTFSVDTFKTDTTRGRIVVAQTV